MNTNEVLQRLFYVDVTFDRLSKKPSNANEFNAVIKDLKNKADIKSLDEIKGELKNGDLIWFNRLANQNCKFFELKLSDLCIDDYHSGIDIGRLKVKRGDKIEEISQSITGDSRTNSLIECSFFEELISEVPIVVRPYQNIYEVISGNHRAISLVKKGVIKIKCLCFCGSSDSNLCKTLNFN